MDDIKATTRLRRLSEQPEMLVMPGAYEPIGAKLIAAAGFESIQCTGAGIAGTLLGLPDYSMLGMSDMVAATARIVDAVDIPVMADGDTGFGNAVNAWYAVQAFERVGAAGVNLEDQVMPKRCGHLDGRRSSRSRKASPRSARRRTRAGTGTSSSTRAPTRSRCMGSTR